MLIPENLEYRKALLESMHTKSIFLLDDALGIFRLPFKMTPAPLRLCSAALTGHKANVRTRLLMMLSGILTV